MPPDAPSPDSTTSRAAELAADLWGVRGEASALPGERDDNFLIRVSRGPAYVLKLSMPGEAREAVELQNRVLARLARAGGDVATYAFPRVVPLPAGAEIAEVEVGEAGPRLARLLTHLPGTPLATFRPHTPGLLEGIGAMLGALDGALAPVDGSPAERELKWDLRRGLDVIAARADCVTDPARRALLDRLVDRFRAEAGPRLGELRQALIHNDGNDYNVLVRHDAADPLAPPKVTGLVDFGDMVHSWLAAEPAIAAAYAMLGRRDPLRAAARVLAGYHRANALTAPEIEVVFELAILRLCVSVACSAEQARSNPDNAYLRITEAPAWALLERLDAIHPRLARATLRAACDLPPSPAAVAVERWLREHGGAAAAVLAVGASPDDRLVLDLSVGSPELVALEGDSPVEAWTGYAFGAMARAGARLGLGRYDEARRWYTTDAYRTESDEEPEWRTVHIGVDLFAEPGTAVRAPLDGVVHGFADNAARLDYGPTIVLRHEPAEGVVFHTLYGHLARDSLAGLEAGRAVRRGEVIGRIGAPPDNGDWAPHLHLQVVTDMLDARATFPGVARPSDRSVMLALCPDPNLLLRYPELTPAAPPDTAALLERRRRLAGPSLSLSYAEPLHIVRGRRQWLYDAGGRPFLDCVNNVAHVGHSHPRVVEALARQAAVLNTNTRYLHEALLEYAERLTATLPEPLSVCYFVCSGSEANELALRLARAYTGRRGVVVQDGAYHGNTSSLIELSPYKFDGPGGRGAPPWVRKSALPDPYRGVHRGDDGRAAHGYAESVRRAAESLERDGHGVAAFFAEPLLSCGGQIVPPAGYLAHAFERVRGLGGVCVADEVQIGFGRVGEDFWGFRALGAVPDIVTMGKPIGNGHPLGAVVTTPEIAAAFDNGMEYFNTFGGNPVSCAAGLAVLDVLEEEQLAAHAAKVGARLLEGLRTLTSAHPVAGEARGLGLFLGLELVLDPLTREPAPRHARHLVERMRRRGILLSTDGPDHNVIKIKPPLVFDDDDAARLLAGLDDVLGERAFGGG